MNPFHRYLENRLAEKLKMRSVVVWYDRNSAFTPFIDDLAGQPDPEHLTPTVTLDSLEANLIRFRGAYFEVKDLAEPLTCMDRPAPLLIYIPGESHDKHGSVLMELELAGHLIEWQLKRLARFCLREKFTDGVIDDMLAPENLNYRDVVGFFDQSAAEKPSMLRAIFKHSRDNPSLIAAFLADPARDADITDKGAGPELFRLLTSRLGFEPAPDAALADARQSAFKYILVNEFRADLTCDPPPCVAMIPSPRTKEQLDLVNKTARILRDKHPEAYEPVSDAVAGDLNLAAQAIDPRHLGKVDTFRFEEAALLTWAGELIRQGRYDNALQVVAERKRSFWIERRLARQAQWEACRRTAELGALIAAARTALRKPPGPPDAWVAAYCLEEGWHRVDQAQHAMEAWVAKMDEEPENEAALETVRQAYENLLDDMTSGFVASLSENNWTVGGVMPQTQVYADAVAREKTPVAYFLVDAMRYAMVAALQDLLADARDLVLKPAVAVWPTITPLGMAALLPGAEAGFSVVKEQGKLAARVEDAALSNVTKRMKYLKSRAPGAVEMQLEKLLEMSAGKLEKTVAQAPLTVVRSQEIDALGELAGNLVARQLMDTMVGNVARAIKKLATAGVRRFVVTADHGHLFTRRKEDAYKTDPPGGATLEIHRRCWIGHGGVTPPGTVRLSGAQLGYDTDLEFIFPKGVGVFKTGGDLGFHHGGLSLQEMIIPVLTLKLGQEKPPEPDVEVRLSGAPSEIANRTFGIQLDLTGIFEVASFTVRPLLLSKGVIVGRAGMAVDAEYDQTKGDVALHREKAAKVGMILENDDVDALRVVVQDPATDGVLAQSKDIKVKLGTR